MKFSEYDAFGPWIYEIDDNHPIPPLFENYIKKFKNPLILIKIPIKKERRNVKPGMNLYNFVIGAYNDFIYIMEYRKGKIKTRTISYNFIEAIENSISLLCGKLKIFTTDSVFELNYNTVSDNVIYKFVKIIRNQLPVYNKDLSISNKIQKDQFTFFFDQLWDKLNKLEDNLKYAAYQPELEIDYLNDNIFVKILKKILKPRLLASLHLYNKKELIIISCGKGVKYKKEVNYNYKYLFIPFQVIQSVIKEDSLKYKNTDELLIKTKNYSFPLYMHKENLSSSYLNKKFV